MIPLRHGLLVHLEGGIHQRHLEKGTFRGATNLVARIEKIGRVVHY